MKNKLSKREITKTNFKKTQKTSQIGTKTGETRATFIIKEDQLSYIKALAYFERRTIKDVLSDAIDLYTQKIEINKRGE